jgi:hypothetical protein
MTFRLHQAQYDDQTERAYVEFRRGDGDGGEQLAAVFTYRSKERLSKQRIKGELSARPAMYSKERRQRPR